MLSTSRHRTRVACLSCRRKKLKCNGLQPCATCSAKSLPCLYASVSSEPRRHTLNEQRPLPPFSLGASGVGTAAANHYASRTLSGYPAITPRPYGEAQGAPIQANSSLFYSAPLQDPNEEEHLSEASRMLQDGRGRLLYLGDSASLSYLDTIRRLVEKTVGVSDFTSDPHKHSLLELPISTGLKPTHVLPDREAAEFLLDSFFSNTVGVIQVLDRDAFINEVATIYSNPLSVEQSRLCLLNLVFAVGLQMSQSSVAHNFRESQILKRLGSDLTERAKIFYLNAAHLNDPVSGFEDGDITSIQALLLITLFMLTIAKRNAAWAYFGMQFDPLYALGLHRKTTATAFTSADQRLRKNIWRSMYILDCYLSASLGRPNGISSRDAADLFTDDADDDQHMSELEVLETAALRASVRAARLLGEILSSVYAERKISVKFVQKSSKQFQEWKDVLPTSLHWRNISLPNEDPRATLAQLHVNLYYFHGVILLTRPFLLQKILNQARLPRGNGENMRSPEATKSGPGSPSAQTDSFSAACVRASLYSIDIVQSAILKRALPRRDPFVIYWLFSASLIVFSNAFCNVYGDTDSNRAMQTSLDLHRYLAETDPLAQRYLQILTSFHETISGDSGSRIAPSSSRNTNQALFANFFGDKPRLQGTDAAGSHTSSHASPMQPMDAVNRRPSRDDQPLQATPATTETQAGNGNREPIHMSPNLTIAEISPPDYSLDFDNFLSLVSQSETAYQLNTQ
ncbi:hypothetical protein CIHG_01525 [Coccidioides immitis H538.4]|uniref:Zn(2)-C6 fungal-type domain-containing protein n=1 Tax=Coccidioides immitis H538.4 TaxID=396776 RepID=A0A0J8RFR3_COCIT|nr:hypothetical protein CIHG_01525 [Coccidioides immitis H538.4]